LKDKKAHGEASQEELHKLRASKKNAKKIKDKEKEIKLNQRKLADPVFAAKLNNSKRGYDDALKSIQQDKNTRIAKMSEGDGVTSSSAVFKKLQQEARAEADAQKNQRPEKKQKRSNSSQYKM